MSDDFDELNEKRQQYRAAEGILQTAEAFQAQVAIQEFQAWILEHMGPCADNVAALANSFLGMQTGSIIGHWFDCGATPELLKEYMSRFIDMTWKQFQVVRKG